MQSPRSWIVARLVGCEEGEGVKVCHGVWTADCIVGDSCAKLTGIRPVYDRRGL